MTNSANIVSITGRIVRDPMIFENKDGSRKVKATIAVQNNFKSGPDKKRQSHFIAVEQFIPVQMDYNPWDSVVKGSLIQISAHMESNIYEKNGETVYTIAVVVDNINYLESRVRTAARRVANARAAAFNGDRVREMSAA